MYKVSYTGDGVTTEFAFVFPFFQIADVQVAIDNNMAGVGAFSVIPNPGFDSGSIVFAHAPNNGAHIDIFRQVSLSRVIDYQPTVKIDPECLNRDFNFLLAALQDIQTINIDLSDWANTHDNVLRSVSGIVDLISDKLSGGGALGVYNNLVSVLQNAQPYLINDYGSITEPAPNENKDDYGVL